MSNRIVQGNVRRIQIRKNYQIKLNQITHGAFEIELDRSTFQAIFEIGTQYYR